MPGWFFCFCFSFFFFWPQGTACRILVSWPEIETVPPAVEDGSLNHWTSREFPRMIFLGTQGTKVGLTTLLQWETQCLRLEGTSEVSGWKGFSLSTESRKKNNKATFWHTWFIGRSVAYHAKGQEELSKQKEQHVQRPLGRTKKSLSEIACSFLCYFPPLAH